MSTHAIILAAGGSRRMGEPKALLEIDGEVLVRRAIRRARAAGATPVVVLGAHAERIQEHLDGASSTYNPAWRDGMGSSLARGIESLPSDAERAVVLAVDQPDVDPGLISELIDACGEDVDASATSYETGVLGIPACFGSSVFSALLEATGDRGARSLLRSGALRVAQVPGGRREIDVDTPTQWSDYLENASREAS